MGGRRHQRPSKLTHCGAFSWAFFHQTFGLLGYWNSLFPLGETEALNEDNAIYCSSFITLLKDVKKDLLGTKHQVRTQQYKDENISVSAPFSVGETDRVHD